MRLSLLLCACLIYMAACGNGGGSTEPHHTEDQDTINVVFLSPTPNQTITLDTFRIEVKATSKKGGPYYYFVNLDGFTYPDSTKNSLLYVVGGPMSNGTHCVTARAKNGSSVVVEAHMCFELHRDSTIASFPNENGVAGYCSKTPVALATTQPELGLDKGKTRDSGKNYYCGFADNDSGQIEARFTTATNPENVYRHDGRNVLTITALVEPTGSCFQTKDVFFYLGRSDDGGKTFSKFLNVSYTALEGGKTFSLTPLYGPSVTPDGYTVQPMVAVKYRKCSGANSVKISFTIRNQMDGHPTMSYSPPPVTVAITNP